MAKDKMVKLHGQMAMAVVALASMMSASAARAEDSAQTFINAIDRGDQVMLVAIHSFGIGFLWSNAYLEQSGRQKLFCAPRRLALTAEQSVSILKRYIEANPTRATTPAGLALLLAYQDAFPCNGQD
jgi:hypothetical protein